MYWLFHAAIFRRPRKLFLELLCRRTRLMAIFRSKAKLRTAVRSRIPGPRVGRSGAP
jgi:hypothetical protein